MLVLRQVTFGSIRRNARALESLSMYAYSSLARPRYFLLRVVRLGFQLCLSVYGWPSA
jgi:hypothetical protein